MKITRLVTMISWAFAVFVLSFIMTDYLLIEKDYKYIQYIYFIGLILLIIGPVLGLSLWNSGVWRSFEEYQSKKKILEYEITLLQTTRYEISKYFESQVKDKIDKRVNDEMGRKNDKTIS